MAEPHPTAINERHILSFFWKATLKHKKGFVGVGLFLLGFLGINTLLPFYAGKLLAALGTAPEQATEFLPYMIAAGVVGLICNRIGAASLFRMQAKTMSDLQMLTLNNLLQQSVGFHNNRIAGKLVSDALDFPQAYNMVSAMCLINLTPLFATLVIGIVLVSLQSLVLGGVLIGMVAAALGSAIWQSKRRKPLRRKRLAATKEVTGHLADTIVNNHAVKTFAQETREMESHRKLNHTLRDLRLVDWTKGAYASNNRMIGLLAFQIIFAFVIIDLVRNDPSMLAIGIFAFTYSVTVSNNLITFNSILRQLEEAFLQAAPMLEHLDRTPEIQDKPGSSELRVTKGGITFSDVDFRYRDSSEGESVFEKLNLAIKPGEKIGLVGTSGGGKTTLTRLLLHFDDIQAGTISIDDQSIAEVTQSSLRRAIAYVPQEPLMFHRTVSENIAYGKQEATPAEIEAAARQANAHDFIVKLSDGYDTLVGERGVKLSGGQRQRIAIARAILKNSPILVLDEATSALDSESEKLIQEALQGLMQHRTALVIAHRLSTIQKMDRIIVLEGGKVAEQGTHKQLLHKNGVYAKLWNHQSGGFLED